jgi:hypothetical protein
MEILTRWRTRLAKGKNIPYAIPISSIPKVSLPAELVEPQEPCSGFSSEMVCSIGSFAHILQSSRSEPVANPNKVHFSAIEDIHPYMGVSSTGYDLDHITDTGKLNEIMSGKAIRQDKIPIGFSFYFERNNNNLSLLTREEVNAVHKLIMQFKKDKYFIKLFWSGSDRWVLTDALANRVDEKTYQRYCSEGQSTPTYNYEVYFHGFNEYFVPFRSWETAQTLQAFYKAMLNPTTESVRFRIIKREDE